MDTYHRWMEVCVPVSFGGLPCTTAFIGSILATILQQIIDPVFQQDQFLGGIAIGILQFGMLLQQFTSCGIQTGFCSNSVLKAHQQIVGQEQFVNASKGGHLCDSQISDNGLKHINRKPFFHAN
jgi:hypothetical protein